VWLPRNEILGRAWDHHTIHGFYFALYHVAPPASRGAWFPYELDVLWSFYTRQQELGAPLTPLDRQALAGAVSLKPTTRTLSVMVHEHVGVDYPASCVTTHRHLLVTGSPKPFRRSRHCDATDGTQTPDVVPADETAVAKRPRAPRALRGPNRSPFSYIPVEVLREAEYAVEAERLRRMGLPAPRRIGHTRSSWGAG
jgi:hypothetical protein